MLLEADEVEVQVLNSILFKQVLADQARQIYTCLGKCIVLVQGRVSLNRTKVASVVAHIQGLFRLVSPQRVSESVRDPIATRVLPCCRVIVRRW